eukprot:450843_1
MWNKWFDKVYDGLICAFSFIDIFCDVAVTMQFYNKGHMIFFWISVFILFLAQISYSVLICLSLDPILHRRFDHKSYKERNSERNRKYVILFLTVLPFGQLVPLYLLISNAFPKQFDKLYKWGGYKNMLHQMQENLFFVNDTQPESFKHNIRRRKKYDITCTLTTSDDENNDTISNESDPLSLYIRHKLMSHLGFIIEAVIEAIPQSILQMIFLIMYSSNYDSVSTINLISIFMSMIVVTSKGTILSYSIYRSAAIFNFLCFAIDIFGIFCVVSWLFCANPQTNYNNKLFEYELCGYKMWSSSYYYFTILRQILQCVFIGGMCAICLGLSDSYRYASNQPWRKWFEIFFIAVIFSLIFFPIALICLMIRFTLLPLLVLRVFDHSQNKSFQFYNTLFSFLTDSSSLSQIHNKLLISNWMLAKIATNSNNIGVTYGISYNCNLIQKHYSKTQTMSLSFIYAKLGCPMLAKYHQIIEVLSLLFCSKGLWGFLFVKIIFVLRLNSENNKYLKFLVKSFYYFLRFIYVPLDINDISFLWNNNGILNIKQQLKFEQLEKRFYETIKDIQQIINWKDFVNEVKQVINDFLNTDWKQKWIIFKRNVILEWNRFMNYYTHKYVKTQIINGFKWFFIEGLHKAIKQDIINISYILKRKSIPNEQICEWNIPRCWGSFSIMFGEEGSKSSAYYSTDRYWNEYKYLSTDPWIGRGIWVFIVVIVYKCIHGPIKWFVGGTFVEFMSQFIGVLCGVFTVILLLVLALYSVLLPIIFLFQHWYHYGLFCIKYNTLQIILTLFYFLILSGIIGLFSRVWKFVYTDIHLFRFFSDTQSTPLKYANFVIDTYKAAPIRNEIVIGIFGIDIGGLILRFLPKWHILNDDEIIKKKK